MKNADVAMIEKYRKEGYGYKKIASLMGLSPNTIKSYLKRRKRKTSTEMPSKTKQCKLCGREFIPKSTGRSKQFCSDSCRSRWWNKNKDKMNKSAFYSFTCSACGKNFTAYGNPGRKYCSRECYMRYRYGGGQT